MFGPEPSVLIACGAPPGNLGARMAQALSAPLDWRKLAELAEMTGMLPMLSRALQTTDAVARVPPEFAADVRARTSAKTLGSLVMAAELGRIMRSFEAAGISALTFKGPALAHVAYGSLSLRDATDLDIYVPREQVESAIALLDSDGYRSLSPELRTDLAGTNEVALRRPTPKCDVDLHWQFTPPYFLAFDGIRALKRSVTLSASGFSARTLRVEDLLIYLCLHGARDCWSIRSSCDVAMILRNCAIDWDDVMRETLRARCRRVLAVGLELAARIFEATLPSEVLRYVEQDTSVGQIAAEIATHMSRDEQDFGGAPGGALLHLRMIESLAGRARYLWRRAVQPNQLDADFVALPRQFAAAYYAVRPVRIALGCLGRLRPASAAAVDSELPAR